MMTRFQARIGWRRFKNAADAHPDTDVFAGRILPSSPDGEPAHLDPIRGDFGILFSLTSTGEGPVTCAMAWGPNMVDRARVFQSGCRFDARFNTPVALYTQDITGPNSPMCCRLPLSRIASERIECA